MPRDETIRERALDWAVRAGDPAFDDWDGFTRWLEESPAHGRAYDEIAAAVADGAEIAAKAPQAANDDFALPARPVRRRWAIGALAASLALAVGFGLTMSGKDRYVVETAAGEMKTIALSDGSSLALSGGTRLELDRDDPRFARLERGQALFTIRHDDKRPFVVLAGDDRLVDAGTVFDVTLDAQRMQVAVSEGLVLFNPEAQNVKVAPGRVLTRRGGAGGYTLAPIAAEQVGEWRGGRLTFEDAPLGEVAARLSRMTGVDFRTPEGSTGSFSGSILVASVREDPASLGPLLGASVRREAGHWIIAPH